MLRCTLILIFGLASALPLRAVETFHDPGFHSELVTSLPPFWPVGVTWAPDGRMFIWQKNGIVRIFKNRTLLETPFLDFQSKVNTHNDNGMLGLAIDPDFASNGYVYLTYIFDSGGKVDDPKIGRLVRVTADPANPDVMLPGSELIIMNGFPVDYGTHVLGTIRFARDGTMFFGNGDGADMRREDPNAFEAQDLNGIRGKIFRINRDGSAPIDNPFYDGMDSIRSKVWCYGVRNPYRFSLHPATGEPYFADVGWDDWEEINRGTRGGNFGWPCYEGTPPHRGYQQWQQCSGVTAVIPPIAEYHHQGGDLNEGGTCLVGGDFYTGSEYPPGYHGNYFYADYSGQWIHRLTLDASGTPTGRAAFVSGVPRPTCVEQGPDGLLYYVSISTGEIRRIRYFEPMAVASATPTYGYSPLTVSFSSAGSKDPAGGPLVYFWDFGDGTVSVLPNPSHTYIATGVRTFTARLEVRNADNQTASATVKITVGSVPPSPVISAPADWSTTAPGDVVHYHGYATDPEDGTLPPDSLRWTVLLHHDTHVHPAGETIGSDGSFVVEDHGTIGTFWYEILLTATDRSGLQATRSVSLSVRDDTTPPTAPSELTANAASSSQINLRWAASNDNFEVNGYRIERCTGGGCANFVEVASATGTTFNDTGLSPQTTYRYRVRATDAAGNLSGYSNVASATTSLLPLSPLRPGFP